MTTSIIAGSTGLIGGNVVKVLSNKKKSAIALTRRSIPNLPPNITEMIIDFDTFEKNGSLPSCNNVFICLGTTIKTAGSKENFRKVDIDYCLSIARKAKESGAETLSLISSIGANSSSKNFYLRTKGELEESIQSLGFSTVNIFRPSFLVGERSEKRLAEKIAINLAKIMDLFLIGTASKYRSVKAESLAKTMVLSVDSKPGVNYFYFDDFLK
ncbi:hypothetical protein ABXT44_05605 [Candidatus Pseudothioglobus sp. Uisw_041]|uniref:hypothetical protein n=1 Tax=Candidatus Pseudothioglobus sp. Uisw_041 TaxID=3230996 RepID=UPI003A842EEA